MKLLVNGESVEAIRCEVVQSEEKACTYLLSDGSVVKGRCIMTGVWRIKDKFDGNGLPLYHVSWHVISTAEPTEP